MKLSRAKPVTPSERQESKSTFEQKNINVEVEEFKLTANSERTRVVTFSAGGTEIDAVFFMGRPKYLNGNEASNQPQSPNDESPYPATPHSHRGEPAVQNPSGLETQLEEVGIRENDNKSENGDDQSDDSSKDARNLRVLPKDLDLQEQELFANSLLSLIDNGKGDFLMQSGDISNLEKLKTFAVASVYVISQSSAVNNLENMPVKSLVNQIPNLLEMTRPKRKDQKLRMIYNSIFKMIVNAKIKHSRQNFPSKFDIFLSNYPSEEREDLKRMLVGSKAPSKKKLKAIFGTHPEIRNEFHRILENEIFMKEYLAKRQSKSEQIYRKFHELYKQFGNDPVSISKVLGSTFKAFPWSISEIRSSCEILFQITIECLVQARKISSLEQQIRSSAQLHHHPEVSLGKRSPVKLLQSIVGLAAKQTDIVVPEAKYSKQTTAFSLGSRPSAFQTPCPPSFQKSEVSMAGANGSGPSNNSLNLAASASYPRSPESLSAAFSFVFLKDLNPYVPWKPQHLY